MRASHSRRRRRHRRLFVVCCCLLLFLVIGACWIGWLPIDPALPAEPDDWAGRDDLQRNGQRYVDAPHARVHQRECATRISSVSLSLSLPLSYPCVLSPRVRTHADLIRFWASRQSGPRGVLTSFALTSVREHTPECMRFKRTPLYVILVLCVLCVVRALFLRRAGPILWVFSNAGHAFWLHMPWDAARGVCRMIPFVVYLDSSRRADGGRARLVAHFEASVGRLPLG